VKKVSVFAIAFLLMLSFSSINGGNVHPMYVNNGTILYVGGTGPGNYTSIQDAINDAENGYTIYVYYRVYNESIVINKSISLIGIEENEEMPEINGNGRNYAVNLIADECVVKGFKVINYGNFSSENWGHGVKIFSSSNIIENNSVECNFVPFYLFHSSDNIISGNKISKGTMIGLHISDGNDNTVTKNNISDNPFAGGIALVRSSNNIVSKNEIWNNFHGIELVENVNNNTISYNNVCNNQQYGITISSGSYNQIIGNKVWHNGHDGIMISCGNAASSHNIISHNNISYNGWNGIYLLGNWPSLNNNTIYRNNISNNQKGVYLYWMCKNNFIKENNFIGNEKNAAFHLFDISYHNIWLKNHWSDWKLLLPKPIFGTLEEPLFHFLRRWLNFDWSPATEPYEW